MNPINLTLIVSDTPVALSRPENEGLEPRVTAVRSKREALSDRVRLKRNSPAIEVKRLAVHLPVWIDSGLAPHRVEVHDAPFVCCLVQPKGHNCGFNTILA